MNEDEVLVAVLRWIAGVCESELPFDADTDLESREDFDSLALEEVLTTAEDELGVYIPENEVTAARMGTPRRLAQTIASHFGAAGTGS